MSTFPSRKTTILLTGATSGIGAALTDLLLAQGHVVIAVARRASTLPERPGLIPLPFDLADLEGIPGLVSSILQQFPDLSILINNAAIQIDRALTAPDTRPQDLMQEASVNLIAPALLASALAPHLRQQPAAAIVNLSSGLATFPKQNTSLYCATKAGLSNLTTSLRWQLEGTPVRVVEVVLPLVDTPMTAGRGRGKITATAAAQSILLGLASGRPAIRIGAARLLPLIARLAPWLGLRLLRRG